MLPNYGSMAPKKMVQMTVEKKSRKVADILYFLILNKTTEQCERRKYSGNAKRQIYRKRRWLFVVVVNGSVHLGARWKAGGGWPPSA